MCYSLCVAVCAHSVPLRHFRLSQLCTNSPPGSSGLSHLLSACWASSNLAASDGETGALGVSSPQDCQKSSVKSPYRLALQAPRKLTRRWDWRGADTGRNFFFFCLCCNTITLSQKTSSMIPTGGHFIWGTLRANWAAQKMKWTSLCSSLATDQQLSLLLSLISCSNFLSNSTWTFHDSSTQIYEHSHQAGNYHFLLRGHNSFQIPKFTRNIWPFGLKITPAPVLDTCQQVVR